MSKISKKNFTKGKQTFYIEEPAELLPFLLKTFHRMSRNSVKAMLTRGQIFVDGKSITQHNYLLQKGQKVEIQSNKDAIKKDNLVGITILYEDSDMIVINKDAGILSVAAKNPQELTAYRQLTNYVKEEDRRNRIFVVHRLDRDTSGVMLYAKTQQVKEALQNNWKDIVKERTYLALVEGAVSQNEETISSWLSENKAMKVYSSPYDNGGKHAVTHFKKISGNARYSLLEAELETGRKNQIRVHMQSIGHPIAGDKKYGAASNPLKRLGLHASVLAFIHPQTKKLVRFTAEAPGAFYRLAK